jgi:hypothetical protein
MAVATLICSSLGVAMTSAATIRIHVDPSQTPDEELPRIDSSNPIGYGPDSWQGPATGKTNWHARYQADGDALSILFPSDAMNLRINDLASISYFTNRPSGTPAGRDWWIQIYTRTGTGSDEAGWYGHKFTNNYNDHTTTDVWTEYSTATGMTFDGLAITGEQDLATLKMNVGNELIEMISVQTDSGWNGFDGLLDGLQITLTNENVGQVNFGSQLPEPSSYLAWSSLALCLGAGAWRKKRQQRLSKTNEA